MPQSLSSVYLHLIFSTQDRIPYLKDASVRAALHEYMGGISHGLDCPPLIIGGVEDHVHILARFSRSISQAEWVRELKRSSSLWMKKHGPNYSDFSWQSGYGVSSVSVSNLSAVEQYISRQEEHHHKESFQEEYRRFLRKHGLEWNEEYVWE
jgi:putative transposase